VRKWDRSEEGNVRKMSEKRETSGTEVRETRKMSEKRGET